MVVGSPTGCSWPEASLSRTAPCGAVFGPFISWGFVGTGLYACGAAGLAPSGRCCRAREAWLLAPLPAASNPTIFTFGLVLGSFWGPVLAHALLSFPTGRLRRRRERALVIAAYTIGPLSWFPLLLVTDSDAAYSCVGACPDNVLLVAHDDSLSQALLVTTTAIWMTLALLTVWLLVARWRAAGPSERRGLAPLFAVGGGTLALIVLQSASQVEAFSWLAFAAFAATPFAFLAGLARADVSQSRGVRSLVARLADLPERADLRDALADALGDPTLHLAFWLPEQERYVDASGAPMVVGSTAGDGDRTATAVTSPRSSMTGRWPSTPRRSARRARRPRCCSRTSASTPSCAPTSSSSVRPARGSWRRATPSAAGSSATSTTARSHGS